MALTFQAVRDPDRQFVESIASLSPDNPFYTFEYLEVRRGLGLTPYALAVKDNAGPVAGCLAFLSVGRVNARLEVTSLPTVPDKEIFWQGLIDLCRSQHITVLDVHTFSSFEGTIGRTEGRIGLKRRSEYRLDLTVPDLWEVMTRRHHRLVKKARSNGVALRRGSDGGARERHVELANLSLNRRRGRGEEIDYSISRAEVDAFIDRGAGEIFQAVREDEVVSSILVARSRTGAYAQSSGSSDEGRKLGSSHFLFHEVGLLLRSEGVTVFNLGGADEHSVGLQEFKLGLGAVRIELESAEFYTGSSFKRYLTRAAAIIKSFPGFPIGV